MRRRNAPPPDDPPPDAGSPDVAPHDEVMAAMERADLVLLLTASVPAYLAAVWVRALRWRYLTESIAPMERGVLFRAMAIGFTANNLLPLRIGEVVRACDGTPPVDREAMTWAVGRVLRPLRFALSPDQARERIAAAFEEARS